MAKEPKSSGKHQPEAPPAPSDPCHSEAPPASLRTFRSESTWAGRDEGSPSRATSSSPWRGDPVTATRQDWYQAAAFAVARPDHGALHRDDVRADGGQRAARLLPVPRVPDGAPSSTTTSSTRGCSRRRGRRSRSSASSCRSSTRRTGHGARQTAVSVASPPASSTRWRRSTTRGRLRALYEFGLFRQEFIGGKQVEFPDNWLQTPTPWS
jgi:hypothetical protein